jgi:hypothetical protein
MGATGPLGAMPPAIAKATAGTFNKPMAPTSRGRIILDRLGFL